MFLMITKAFSHQYIVVNFGEMALSKNIIQRTLVYYEKKYLQIKEEGMLVILSVLQDEEC